MNRAFSARFRRTRFPGASPQAKMSSAVGANLKTPTARRSLTAWGNAPGVTIGQNSLALKAPLTHRRVQSERNLHPKILDQEGPLVGGLFDDFAGRLACAGDPLGFRCESGSAPDLPGWLAAKRWIRSAGSLYFLLFFLRDPYLTERRSALVTESLIFFSCMRSLACIPASL